MSLTSKVGKYVYKGITSVVKGKVKPKVKVNNKLIDFKAGKKTLETAKNVAYQVKPDIKMPIAPLTLNQTKPSFRIFKNFQTGGINEAVQAELGNISIRLAKMYEAAVPAARQEIKAIFGGAEVSVRAKGANSIYSKLERKVMKGSVIRTDNGAFKLIQDAIGGRRCMENLTHADVLETIRTIKINGTPLNAKEQEILTKLFKNERLTTVEMKVAKQYSRAVRMALAEKQSAQTVNQIMLSSMKHSLETGATTFEKLEQSGLNKELIAELKRNYNKITPLQITELNNYTGHNGIPYFTDRQIADIRKMQVATGNHFDIITCPDAKRFAGSLTKMEADAIKESGYTTAQFNAVLKDGSLAEIQVRGKGPFGEVEHIAYDSRQGKNTLGPIYNEYKDAVKALTDDEYKLYNKYLSDCYDYYRDIELGIKSPKPRLPEGFNPILSKEEMMRLHDLDEAEQAIKKLGFEPHIVLEKAS